MKETEQTLLDQIKNDVAKEWKWNSWNDFAFYEFGNQFNCGKIINEICERYANAKSKASCEATLKKASENAKCEPIYDYSEERAELIGYRVKKSSITDHKNITIV